jgi:N-acetyl-alpha-D-muramate 1-phosphate uridylyltransferase
VNLHHGREALSAHLDQRAVDGDGPPVHRSIEEPEALGTAGALGALRNWIAGRGVLIHNADAWCRADLAGFLAGWDGERPRVLVTSPADARPPGPSGAAAPTPADPAGAAFGPRVGLVATLLPWSEVVGLEATPSGLYETTLGRTWDEGRLDAVAHAGPFVDCGTPADYLAANLAAVALAGGASIVGPRAQVTGSVHRSVVGADARVAGRLDRSVIWDGAVVGPDEVLSQVVRAPGLRRDLDARPG